jgi:hypothetical protein
MEKCEFRFDSLPYNDSNADRLRGVLRKLSELRLFGRDIISTCAVVKHESGGCLAVIELEASSYHMSMAVADCFEAEGLPRPAFK